MQHIPSPVRPTYTQPLIPYLSTKQYDGLPYESYLSREGYRSPQSLKDANDGDATAFLQRWLYYGLLSEFFGHNLLNRFVCKGPRAAHGEYYVDSSPLNELRNKVARSQREHLSKCLTVAESMFRYVTGETKLLDYNMRLSFLLLYDELISNVTSSMSRPINEMGYNAYLWDRPEVPSWCPYYKSWIDREFSVSSAYFLSQCAAPLALQSHVSCDQQACRIAQVPEAMYDKHVRKHVDQHCCCSEVKIDEQALCDIIGDGKLPLVDWTYANDSEGRQTVMFELLAHEPGTPYAAISHVWSDGLGNQNANGLYACQMMRIREIVYNVAKNNPGRGDSSHGSIPFWMDTLCCPVRNQRTRKQTIAKMNEIYRGATYVIVLDSYIAQNKVEDVTDLELCMKVLVSPWMTRLWTLQEANATKSLHIVLKSTIFYLFPKMNSVFGDQTLPSPIATDLMQQIYVLKIGRTFELLKSGNRPPLSDLNLWQCLMIALHHRRITKSSDEVVCIAGLTSLQVAPVLELHDQDRMIWLYNHLPPFPQSIIFYIGMRLQKPGYRWAPRSLLGQEFAFAPSTMDECPMGQITNQGLLVSYTAILFTKDKVDFIKPTTILAIRTSNGWFNAHAEKGIDLEMLLGPYARGQYPGHKLLILLEDASESYDRGILAAVSPSEITKMTNNQRTYIRYIACVTLKECSDGQKEIFDQGMSKNNNWGFDFTEHMNPTIDVPLQEWIVD